MVALSAAGSPTEVLAFWFAPGREAQWFGGGEAFDDEVRAALGPLCERALSGALPDWETTPDGLRALVLLLDQAPRNLFRKSPRSFAGDAEARRLARLALARGDDLGLSSDERSFLYLPLEHSEDLADQVLSEALFATLGNEDFAFSARRHREIVERFGRFPHRNETLGRATTAEEAAFLREPNSSF